MPHFAGISKVNGKLSLLDRGEKKNSAINYMYHTYT